MTRQESPCFVAYVYPGWHKSLYRPDVNEWELLDLFRPYFDGHQPLPRPLNGGYDDSQQETALRQIELALEHGITGFTYFLYYLCDTFVLSSAMDAAYAVATDSKDFKLSATWCFRLPLRKFPIKLHDRSDSVLLDGAYDVPDSQKENLDPRQLPIRDSSIRLIEEVFRIEGALDVLDVVLPWKGETVWRFG
jgi:hypothetical protein